MTLAKHHVAPKKIVGDTRLHPKWFLVIPGCLQNYLLCWRSHVYTDMIFGDSRLTPNYHWFVIPSRTQKSLHIPHTSFKNIDFPWTQHIISEKYDLIGPLSKVITVAAITRTRPNSELLAWSLTDVNDIINYIGNYDSLKLGFLGVVK